MRRRASVLALLVLTACEVALQAPANAMLECVSRAECPPEWSCTAGRCVPQATPCSNDAACDDGLFCNGAEICVDDFCNPGIPPCVRGFDCMESVCDELGSGTGACSVTVDHFACGAGEYCNPAAGCIPGAGCQVDADCHDTYECNGAERCINFVCAEGAPPAVDDGDICTLDGCNDARLAQSLDPVFHVAQSSFDGRACTIPGTGTPGASGVCVSSKSGCVASECGDGVVFAGANETCDDGTANNSDAWSPTRNCNATCTAWAPYCGDGLTDSPHEFCDAGTANGAGTGCSATCERAGTCGDLVPQSLFEQCDDGDADQCDGCRTDCNRGCICSAPLACTTGTRCAEGLCIGCAEAATCGPSCVTCAGTTPLCGGATTGCVCDPSPGPHGSCGLGTDCGASGACTACDGAQRCGQECATCGGNTPVCGGAEAGCVVDPTTHPASGGCAGMPDFTPCRIESPILSYNICIDGMCREPGCGDASCNTPGPSFARADLVTGWEYPDTNQRTCYDMTAVMACAALPCASDGSPAFCGQDAQYGWDTTHPDASVRFTRTSADEPMVTDNITGLIWQGCAGGFDGPACTVGAAYKRTWVEALTYCDDIVWNGYSDWRLPDYHELESLLDLDRNHPSIDGAAFPATPTTDSFFWSSSSRGSEAWYVSFQNGDVSVISQATPNRVRCVRRGASTQPWGAAPRFARTEPVTDQAVVADARTKLMWQGCAAGQVGPLADCTGTASDYSWQAAMTYCEGLTWGGFADWRLPSRAELASSLDLRANPPIDSTVFPGTPPLFWSSSWADPNPSWGAWRLDLDSVGVGFALLHKGNTYGVRCVRPGP